MSYEIYFLIFATFLFSISLIIETVLKNRSFAKLFIYLAIGFQLLLLVTRSLIAKHPPFTNIYETMILLPFLFSLRLIFWKSQVQGKVKFGVIILILFLDSVAIMLPDSMKVIKPLMPALNSIWMYIHVPSYFVAYSSMLVATVLAITALVNKNNKTIMKKLDEEVKIAFFFLNTGLITGAIWAYFCWGNYWSWDPKETWALINIMVLSYYFHLYKKDKVAKAVIVIFTLLTIIFTYFGVTYIMTGLHSYS